MTKNSDLPIKKKRSVSSQIITGLIIGAGIIWISSWFVESKPENCLWVHPRHQKNIALGFREEFKDRLSLTNIAAVVADDAIERYFVSAEIKNKSTGHLYGIGTWVLREIRNDSSFYFAMPDHATQVTIYPNAHEINSGVKRWNPGYQHSIRCVEWKANQLKQ